MTTCSDKCDSGCRTYMIPLETCFRYGRKKNHIGILPFFFTLVLFIERFSIYGTILSGYTMSVLHTPHMPPACLHLLFTTRTARSQGLSIYPIPSSLDRTFSPHPPFHFSPAKLFPGDDTWGAGDVYDKCEGKSLDRTFYDSTNGTCVGHDGGFTIPLNACVGPFGKPRCALFHLHLCIAASLRHCTLRLCTLRLCVSASLRACVRACVPSSFWVITVAFTFSLPLCFSFLEWQTPAQELEDAFYLYTRCNDSQAPRLSVLYNNVL